MKKWLVRIPYHCTVLEVVEADTNEEAVEKAEEQAWWPTLCHQCADHVELDERNSDYDVVAEEMGDD